MYLIVLCALLARTAWATETSCSADSCTTSYPVGDIRNCFLSSSMNQPMHPLKVLPGGGFDNLRNLDKGLVHAYTYRECQMSPDGMYLLPDNVFLIPLQQSNLDISGQFFNHWDNYTDTTASSINIEASFAVISGKYSEEYSSMKSNQVNDKSKTTRVQIRYRLHSAKLQPDAQLHPKFVSSLHEIGANIENNNMGYASYLAELLIRDYGTHYITSIDAGAVLVQTDHINSSYIGINSENKHSVTASATASFFAKLSINYEQTSSNEHQSVYTSHVTHSKINAFGGPFFQPVNFTLNDWVRGVPDNLAAIDRYGEPLHFAINTNTLPHLPEITVYNVAKFVENAIRCYYETNTRFGCTNLNSNNFDFQANLDDNSCGLPTNNYTFGGVFQTCTVINHYSTNLCTISSNPKLQQNPLTGSYSCPLHYTAIKLHEGIVSRPATERVCHEHCFLFFCHTDCRNEYRLDEARYEAYWCAAIDGISLPENSGYLFAGFHTPTTNNPLTGAKSCPKYFEPLRILRDVTVCVSSDYELGSANAVMFGGFYGCNAGNPLAASNLSDSELWPRQCPRGSTQHLVTIDQSCEINFCVEAGTFRSHSLLPVRTPPFTPRPAFETNMTDTVIVGGLYGTVWVKNANGQWNQMDQRSIDTQALIGALTNTEQSTTGKQTNPLSTTEELTNPPATTEELKNDEQPSDKEQLPVIIVVCLSVLIILCLLVIVVIISVWCKIQYRRRKD